MNIYSQKIKNREQKSIFDRQLKHLCEHGGLHQMKARKGKYIPVNVYTSMKETLKTNYSLRVCWDIIQVKGSLISITMTFRIAI